MTSPSTPSSEPVTSDAPSGALLALDPGASTGRARAPSRRFVVVLHTPRDPHSAVYQHYTELASFAAALGHAVTVRTPEDFPELARLHPRWRPLVYPFAVDRWLQREGQKFDVAIFHSYAGWRAVRRGHCPFVAVTAFHGLEPLFYQELVTELRRQGRPPRLAFQVLHGLIVPALARAAARRSTRVLCLNQAEARFLVAARWADAQAVRVVHHGVARQFFIDRRFADRASRLCFVGQWLEGKGIADLVAAFVSLVERIGGLRLCCAGTLAGRDQVLASFPPGVRARVDVYPRVDQAELARLYERADLFVFPTQFEGCSRALLEAMAAGLPIVTTPVGAASDILVPGESAVFVPVRDSRALAEAVGALVEDRERRERLGRAAQAVARRFTLERVHGDLLVLLLETLPRSSAGASKQPGHC